MGFNSSKFFLFFPLVFLMFYAIPHKFRWILLLISSIVFYMQSSQIYIFIPLLIILSAFIGGKYIEEEITQKGKRKILISILFFNLGILIFFKYINFITNGLFDLFNLLTKSTNYNSLFLNLVVPLGLSYITFQAIGYLIEIYRGTQKAEKHLGIFATYLMFFPKIASGPIERAHNFIPQLYEKRSFDYQQVADSFKLIAWGFLKKIVIADRLAVLTNHVFENPHQYSGISLIIAVLLFTVQLYADFSGYTDIALGVAGTLGFKMMKNFDLPFIAKSTVELWRRWHISLSTWFNEYVFNPIVINKRDWGPWAVVFASIVTFLILGLWHGASWNFVMFGFLQGIILSLEFLTIKIRKKIRKKIPIIINNVLGVFFTFLFFSFALIFFKTNSLKDAWCIILNMFNLNSKFYYNLEIEVWEFWFIFISAIFIFFIQFFQVKDAFII